MPPIEQQDMSCQYDGRVVVLEVYINTDEDINAILARVVKAAKGPRLCASVVTVGINTGDVGRELWAELAKASAAAVVDPRAVNVDLDMNPLKKGG